MKTYEVNFDGIVGPTHNYSGLSYGNIASMEHEKLTSNPKEAALQGLKKMKFLMELGLKQAVLPPQERPYVPILRSLGFTGSDSDILNKVKKESPELLRACSSSASMWAANAATMTPSSDSLDKLTHFTPANLTSKFHRSIEPETTRRILKAIFSNPEYFVNHSPLPAGNTFSDEGAANHTRFCKNHGSAGVHLFVYGRSVLGSSKTSPIKYPGRQTLESSQAIARTHRLSPNPVIFAQQNPEAIDAGVFHNDVISVGNENLFFYHEQAFVDTQGVINQLHSKIEEMVFIEVPKNRISLQQAVSTYLFNSQIITLPNGKMSLIAPNECLNTPEVKNYIDEIVKNASNPIESVHYMNLHESMRNGGGPACLRFRVVLNEKEIAQIKPQVFLTETLYHKLTEWVNKHYRDRLSPDDLSDPQLLNESRFALDELAKILNLGQPIYPFQIA